MIKEKLDKKNLNLYLVSALILIKKSVLKLVKSFF